MTDNSRKVIEFLQGNGVGVRFTAAQVQDALGLPTVSSVTGSVTGLCKKGFAERYSEMVEDENGKPKKISYFSLTQAGADYVLPPKEETAE